MSDPATAIFSVLTSKLERGTAVAIREDLGQRWFERIGEKQRAAVIAQLALGMGIALSVKELKVFLDTKAS